jgi:hypothetical protein
MWVDGLIWLEVREKSRHPLDLLQLPVFVLVTQSRKLVAKTSHKENYYFDHEAAKKFVTK